MASFRSESNALSTERPKPGLMTTNRAAVSTIDVISVEIKNTKNVKKRKKRGEN